MNYPIYGNSQFYMQDLQNMKDRIEGQMRQVQQQLQQPQMPQVNQTFQLAPNLNMNNELEGKYAQNIEEVKNTFVMKTGIFINKELNTLWIKNINGDIKTFELNEIVEQDPKDREIYLLKKQIEEMKGMIISANESNNTNVDEQITKSKSTSVQSSKRSNAK